MDKQVFQLAPGLTRNAAWPDIARLADMEEGYQDVSEGVEELIAWQITALKNGLFSVYPGYGHFLPGYDGRCRRPPLWVHSMFTQWSHRMFT